MREVFRLIDRAGPTDKAILIQGASGTGKELVARALHRASGRSQKPFVAINCAALPESLLESELFGHEKGAFTGAIATKLGLFEVADGGTLFIDEIGEMPGALQAKLLRVLEDGSMRRVGSLKEIRVDVRLLAATNRNLQQEVQAGRFREDLFYRINVLSLELPRLAERSGDVRLLVARFLGDDLENHRRGPGRARTIRLAGKCPPAHQRDRASEDPERGKSNRDRRSSRRDHSSRSSSSSGSSGRWRRSLGGHSARPCRQRARTGEGQQGPRCAHAGSDATQSCTG